MRYFLLFLLVPMFSAQAGPSCSDLQRIAENLEKDIQKKRLPDCDKLKPSDIGQPETAIGFPNIKKRDGADGNWDYRCKDFSAVDMQLKSIENELALLTGINKLKDDIKQGLETFKKFPEKDLALTASKNFYTNLKVAASLEDFLHTNNDKGENILSKVIADKAGFTDIHSFAGLLRTHCAGFPNVDTVCKKGWGLDSDVFAEIKSFIKVGKDSVGKFDKKQVKDLTKALAIQKEKQPYSYNQLLLEIKDPGDGMLAKADLEKIKSMPELEHVDDDFHFLKQIKEASKNLNKSADLVFAQGAPDRMRTLVTDLKTREEWELKSKLSLVLHQYQETMPADVKTKCDAVRELGDDVSKCLDPLAKAQDQLNARLIENYSYEFKYGQAHIAKLQELQTKCIPKADLTMDPACDALFKGITDKMAALTEKASVLQALKTKHMQSSPDLINMRNFALQKLLSGECMTEGDADIKECYPELGTIPREAATLAGAAGEIMFVLENPKSEINIDQICDETKEKIYKMDQLCALADEEAAKKNAKAKVNQDSYNAPTDPDHRDTGKESLLAAGQSLLSTVAQMFAPKPQPMFNPYNHNMNPYPMMAQPQDISQKIMTPYLASGYGTYFPTPGLRPYSSISSNVGTYSAYSMGTGKLFNSPVGW